VTRNCSFLRRVKHRELFLRGVKHIEGYQMAAGNSFVQHAIPKFDGYYDHWSMLMENFLRSKEYWSLVENGVSIAAEGVEITEAQR
jgi:hypothetical protein